jgi:hypothetical protein
MLVSRWLREIRHQTCIPMMRCGWHSFWRGKVLPVMLMRPTMPWRPAHPSYANAAVPPVGHRSPHLLRFVSLPLACEQGYRRAEWTLSCLGASMLLLRMMPHMGHEGKPNPHRRGVPSRLGCWSLRRKPRTVVVTFRTAALSPQRTQGDHDDRSARARSHRL